MEKSGVGSFEKKVNAQPLWMNSRFMRACRCEPVDSTPVWLMRQAGRYMKDYRELRDRVPFLDLCKNPDLVAEVTIGAAKKIGADAAIIFADLLLIAEPMGFALEYEKGEGPRLNPPIRHAAQVNKLRDVNPEESLGYLLKALRLTRAQLDPGLPLIGFCGAPFTLASYLIEGGGTRTFRRTKALMYSEPAAWHALLAYLARNLSRYANSQIAAGAQALQVFDSWVGCLGPADYREFVLPHSRALLQGIDFSVPVIHFGVGTGTLLEGFAGAGGSVIGLDAHVELDHAWARLGDRRAVQGNLDPVALFAPPDYIRERVIRILEQAAGRPGHIFNLGHGILPETPFDHVVQLIEMVHEESRRFNAEGVSSGN